MEIDLVGMKVWAKSNLWGVRLSLIKISNIKIILQILSENIRDKDSSRSGENVSCDVSEEEDGSTVRPCITTLLLM